MKENTTQSKTQALANKLGIKEIAKKNTSVPITKLKEIKNGIKEVVHKFLCDKYPNEYYEVDATCFIEDKDGKFNMQNEKGYRLVLPKKAFEIENDKHNGFMVGNPTNYVDGITKLFALDVSKIGETRNNK